MSIAVGVIGTGVMGAEHARILQHDVPGAHLAAVHDLEPERARAFGAATFPDPIDLIRSPGIAAVVIASPDATHGSLVHECLRSGKHVLCEKPLALNAAEALGVVEAEVKLGKRLVQVGYMRRFDPAYEDLQSARLRGVIGTPVLLHNVHRNARAPEWFTGLMAVTNSFVHEVDISRWLLGSEMVSASVLSGPNGDPLLITMLTDLGEIVSTEVFMNATYGYHVHTELVGRLGAVSMAPPGLIRENLNGHYGHSWPMNWVPRFKVAYQRQMRAWIESISSGVACGASAWDGYVATSIAEKIAAALQSGKPVMLDHGRIPDLYA